MLFGTYFIYNCVHSKNECTQLHKLSKCLCSIYVEDMQGSEQAEDQLIPSKVVFKALIHIFPAVKLSPSIRSGSVEAGLYYTNRKYHFIQ